MAEHYSMCVTSRFSTQQGLLPFSLLLSLNVFVVSEHVHPSPSIHVFKLFLKPLECGLQSDIMVCLRFADAAIDNVFSAWEKIWMTL